MENTVSAIKEVTSCTVCMLTEMVQEDCLLSANSNSKANGKDPKASLRSADQSSADFSSLLSTEKDTARKCEDSFNKDPNLFEKIEEDISEGANPEFAKHTDSNSRETPNICKQYSRRRVMKKSSETIIEPRSSLSVAQESIDGNTPSLSNICKKYNCHRRVTKKSSETKIEPCSLLPVAQESIDGNTPSLSTIAKSGSFVGGCSMSSGAIDNSALVRDACTYSDKNNMLDEASSKLKAVKSNSKGDEKTENKGTNVPSKEGVMHDSGTLDQLNKKIGQLDSSKEEHSFSFRKLEKLEAEKPETGLPDLERALLGPRKKKLLVLNLNGLLADIISDFHNAHKTQNKISGKAIFKRPFCDEFLNFCFERFDVGVWSSRKRYNVDSIVDFLMRDSKHKLLFCWDQSKCTYTGFKTLENRYKPLVLKELKKLWNKEESDLPWEKGDYSPSNTLLVDDSPYKALCNPKHTAIFPHPFGFDDEKDNSLGPEGDLHVYLEGISACEDVQQYVEKHPFGQHAITTNDATWRFYRRVIDRVEKSLVPAW